jgi:hypothetical protein
MKAIRNFAVAGALVVAATVSMLAHQITYKGTVISADKAIVKVTVVNEKTRKNEVINFKFDKDTKILRGDVVVTFEAARIQKGEKIAVTTDHDIDEDLALVVRLDVKK